MTIEEVRAIEDIQGTAGFRVMQGLAEQKLFKLKDVMQIDKTRLVAEQTLGRQLAVEVLTDFLSDLKLTAPDQGARKTYE